MVSVKIFMLSVLCDLFVLDLQFRLSLVRGHATLFVVLYCYWFFMVFSCLLLGLAFYVLRVFGIGWGRRKFNGLFFISMYEYF